MQEKQFAADLVSRFTIGDDHTRVALIAFNGGAQVMFSFSSITQDQATINAEIDSTPYCPAGQPGGGICWTDIDEYDFQHINI